MRNLSKVFNKLTLGGSHQTFCARQYSLKKSHKLNIVWLLDTTLGKDHCVLAHANFILDKKEKTMKELEALEELAGATLYEKHPFVDIQTTRKFICLERWGDGIETCGDVVHKSFDDAARYLDNLEDDGRTFKVVCTTLLEDVTEQMGEELTERWLDRMDFGLGSQDPHPILVYLEDLDLS